MYEEKDYIIRQIQLLAKGLGKFMGLEQIKQLIQIDEDQHGLVTDEELKSIVAASKLETIIENKDSTIKTASKEIGINDKQLTKIISNEIVASKEEMISLNNYIEQNLEFL